MIDELRHRRGVAELFGTDAAAIVRGSMLLVRI
jgi:hypothetical protein